MYSYETGNLDSQDRFLFNGSLGFGIKFRVFLLLFCFVLLCFFSAQLVFCADLGEAGEGSVSSWVWHLILWMSANSLWHKIVSLMMLSVLYFFVSYCIIYLQTRHDCISGTHWKACFFPWKLSVVLTYILYSLCFLSILYLQHWLDVFTTNFAEHLVKLRAGDCQQLYLKDFYCLFVIPKVNNIVSLWIYVVQ